MQNREFYNNKAAEQLFSKCKFIYKMNVNLIRSVKIVKVMKNPLRFNRESFDIYIKAILRANKLKF